MIVQSKRFYKTPHSQHWWYLSKQPPNWYSDALCDSVIKELWEIPDTCKEIWVELHSTCVSGCYKLEIPKIPNYYDPEIKIGDKITILDDGFFDIVSAKLEKYEPLYVRLSYYEE